MRRVELLGSRCYLQQPTHSQQIVCSTHEVGGELGAVAPLEAGAAEVRDGFCPAEDLLDAFADPLADAVARMPRRSAVDRRAAPLGDVLCNVGRHATPDAFLDKVVGVVFRPGSAPERWILPRPSRTCAESIRCPRGRGGRALRRRGVADELLQGAGQVHLGDDAELARAVGELTKRLASRLQ